MKGCILLRNITAATVTTAILEYWAYSYSALLYIPADSGKRLVAKYFDSLRRILGSEHYFASAYHPQTEL